MRRAAPFEWSIGPAAGQAVLTAISGKQARGTNVHLELERLLASSNPADRLFKSTLPAERVQLHAEVGVKS